MKKLTLIFLLAFGFLQSQTITYLIVAKGGSGLDGGEGLGGGGGGGVISNSLIATVGTFAITVSDNSSAFGFTALKGGYGSFYDSAGEPPDYVPAQSGGSGGGGSVGSTSGASGTVGQGNNGGTASSAGGGGGGAGGVGGNPSGLNGGTGGLGFASSITGTVVTYGGGGGGSSTGVGIGGAGNGGGGNGASNTTPPTNGINGRGGGGGAANTTYGSTTGGDGVVIIRYTTSQITATGGVITTDGLSTIHTFTTSGSLIVTSVSGGSVFINRGVSSFFK